MDVGVAVLLGLVEADAAGEDEVGAVDQLLLEVEQMLAARSGISTARPCSRRRRARRRDAARRAASSACSTRRRAGRVSAADMRVEQALQGRLARVLVHALGQVRDDDPDIRRSRRPRGPGGRRSRGGRCRSALPRRSTVMSRAKRLIRCCGRWNTKSHRRCEKQIKVGRSRIRRRGLGYRLNWHPDASQHFPLYPPCCWNPNDERAGTVTVPQHLTQIRTKLRRCAVQHNASTPD